MNDSFPSGETHGQRGAEIARRLRDRLFLEALYGDPRTVDIMYRYFSGQTLRQIGKAYGVSGERIRQICSKCMYRLQQLIICFKNDVMEKRTDEASAKLRLIGEENDAKIKAMRAEIRKER